MTNLEIVLSALRSLGRADALALRSGAADMDGTAILAEEAKVPPFDPAKDYSGWPRGAPVADEGQVWTLITPHNAAHYEGRPSTLRALWGLCHTKDPAKAKPFAVPYGTSGMYMTDECIVWADGRIYRCLEDNVVHGPDARPEAWKTLDGRA